MIKLFSLLSLVHFMEVNHSYNFALYSVFMSVFVWCVQIHAYACTWQGQRGLSGVLFYHCSSYCISTGSLSELGGRLEMIKPAGLPWAVSS